MANCDLFLNSIDASCPAQNKMGGARKRAYFVPVEDIASVVYDAADGHITDITLEAGKVLYYLESKKFKTNATYELQVSENGPKLVLQTVNFRAYTETQKEREAVENALKADALAIILPLNDGTVEIYGYSKNAESLGLAATAGGGGTGTAMGDDTSTGMTFSGPEHNFPIQVQLGADQSATIAALDAMLVATP